MKMDLTRQKCNYSHLQKTDIHTHLHTNKDKGSYIEHYKQQLQKDMDLKTTRHSKKGMNMREYF